MKKTIARLGLVAAAAAVLAVPTTANADHICVYVGTFPECIEDVIIK